ncbi:uncharacterized protein BCR38DRAFT_67103 [Pseudomassariella vexata]|uniref:Uncharacterized protein n=1 Tax=Pseudomassariella vexata TaxID=1141098 RepID=A0A1Y2DJ45_9PEZI|nr:uncharacterized protein BCR38DRAFT_67103 [Pseudomassariella vexata]ORY59257.1 hypothetical protein BCR38DRAFT_67103 [Pseudomassariella vexata]
MMYRIPTKLPWLLIQVPSLTTSTFVAGQDPLVVAEIVVQHSGESVSLARVPDTACHNCPKAKYAGIHEGDHRPAAQFLSAVRPCQALGVTVGLTLSYPNTTMATAPIVRIGHSLSLPSRTSTCPASHAWRTGFSTNGAHTQ